jgi:hypothetical protein
MAWLIEDPTDTGASETICIFGPTQSGKTTQIGALCEHTFHKTGKKTRLYAADPGGFKSVEPYRKLGIMEVVNLRQYAQPWEWLHFITLGALPVVSDLGVRWEIDSERNKEVGLYAYDGGTAMAEILMDDQSDQATKGRNIGGQSPNFKYTEGLATVAGYAPSHFNNSQVVLAQKIKQSFRLPGTVLWTFTSKSVTDEDGSGASIVIGPQTIGKAQTLEIARWFHYTFRMVTIAGNAYGQSEDHRLYLKPFSDETTTGGGTIMTNNRVPLDVYQDIPTYLSPASLVDALELLRTAPAKAEERIRERLGDRLTALAA